MAEAAAKAAADAAEDMDIAEANAAAEEADLLQEAALQVAEGLCQPSASAKAKAKAKAKSKSKGKGKGKGKVEDTEVADEMPTESVVCFIC